MKRLFRISQRIGILAGLLLAMAPTSFAAPAPPIGLKVYLQPWDPRTDDDSVKTVLDSRDAISAGLSRTWSATRPALVAALAKALTKPDLLADGVTLYELKIDLNEPELRLTPVSGDTLRAVLTLPDASFEAKATQPTVLGAYANPRCSAHFTLDVTLAIRISDDRSRLLQSAFAPNDAPVTVRDFSADSANFVCDAAKAALQTVGLWQKITREVNDANRPEYKSFNQTLRTELDAALAAIDAQVRVPAQFVRLKVWSDATLPVVLFGVQSVPLPPHTGSVHGRLTIGDLKNLELPIGRCDEIGFSAEVKTGPRPLVSSNGVDLGPAPMARLSARLSGDALPHGFVNRVTGQAQPGTLVGSHCDYALDGLVPGFPNFVSFELRSVHAPDPKSLDPNLRDVLVVQPAGWRYEDAIHPSPQADGRSLTLLAALRGSPGYSAKVDARVKVDPGDPAMAPVRPAAPIERVTLNPQPLPPKARPAVLSSPATPQAFVQRANLPADLASMDDGAAVSIAGKTMSAGEVKREVLALDDRAIIIIGGRSTAAATLKQQIAANARTPKARTSPWSDVGSTHPLRPPESVLVR